MKVRGSVVSSATVSIVVAGMVSALLAPTASASVAGYAATSGVADPDDSAAEPDLPEPQVLTGTAPELKAERTETSRTFLQPDGSFRTVVYPSPVNYQAEGGGWRRIDNSFVDSPRPGYAAENAANGYRLLVPDDAGSAPVRFEAEGEWVSFALAGLDGAPQVSGSEAAYAGGLPGVRVEYEAAAEAAKEAIVLDAPPASTTFTFDLQASGGLRPRLAADGSLGFVDPSGRRVFVMPAPFMFDSSDDPAGSSEAVSFGLQRRGAGGWSLSLTADRAWLTDPARVYPVTIDPTITAQPAAVDCWIWSGAPTAGNCGASADFLKVGRTGAGENIRSLLRFNLSNIPANATVTSGDLALYLDATQSASGLSADYVVRRALKSWTSQATWNRYDGTNAWSSPGGDFGAMDAGRRTMNGADGGYKSFDAAWLVNEWVQGTTPNQGVIVKQAPESTVNTLFFYSSNSPNETRSPKLTVTYTEPPARLRPDREPPLLDVRDAGTE